MEIEKNVPIPQGITGTLRRLKRGESVHIPGKRPKDMSGFVANAKLTGKVTMRTQNGGVRVWRVR